MEIWVKCVSLFRITETRITFCGLRESEFLYFMSHRVSLATDRDMWISQSICIFDLIWYCISCVIFHIRASSSFFFFFFWTKNFKSSEPQPGKRLELQAEYEYSWSSSWLSVQLVISAHTISSDYPAACKDGLTYFKNIRKSASVRFLSGFMFLL